MIGFIKRIGSVLIMVLMLGSVMGQDLIKRLDINDELTATINPGETHQYNLSLEKDQYVLVNVVQKGVDLIIHSFDPSGTQLGEHDSPNGKNGPELFSIITDENGEYSIKISPLDDKQPIGDYTVKVEAIKPKAVTKSEKVDQLFLPWDNNESPGAAVAVVKDGEIVFSNGYGMANLEYDIPITPSSIFHIASVSKQFTAFAVMLLQEDGKLNLDDDVRDYIPEVPDFGKTITLRHLASHTSGMRDQWNLLAMAGWRLDDVITKEHVLKLVSKQKALNFEPGEKYTYCNTGFTLLAEVVARVSGKSFAEFTDERIFKPLGMSSTLFYDDHEKIVKNRAYSYHSSSGGFKKSVLSYANVGATSLFTTVEDLSKWSMNFKIPKVGKPQTIKELNTPAVLNDGETFGGALGQFVGEYKGLNEIQHGGADAGYRTYLTRFPDQNLAVVVFSNLAGFNPGSLAHRVVDIYLEKQLKTEIEEESGDSDEEDANSTDDVQVTAEMMSSYVGEFELMPGFVISVIVEDGQLIGQATGQPSFPLTPKSTTEFKVEGVEATIEFIKDEDKEVNMIKLYQGGQIMEAKRMESFNKEDVDLLEFVGDYYSEELETTYCFKVEEDNLIATHQRHPDINLDPVKKDFFAGNAWYFGQIEMVRDDSGVVNGCKVSSGRVTDLLFKKVK